MMGNGKTGSNGVFYKAYSDQSGEGIIGMSQTAVTKYDTGAVKYTAGKLRMDLIPPEVDIAYAEVLGEGVNRHEDRNWEKGIPTMACIASLKRHTAQYLLGATVNQESGLSHLLHMQFWVNALITYEKRGMVELDDRPCNNRGVK